MKFFLIILYFIASPLMADKVMLDNIDFYGSLRIASIQSDGSATLADKASRVGFKLIKKWANDWIFAGKGEYATRLTRNTKKFFFKGDEFSSSTDTGSVFSNRLGFLEAFHKKYGLFRVGKQWSVYYDTTKWTDDFNLFGGEASGTYSFFSDGGFLGTGRADNAFTYRNKFEALSIGVQYVFTNDQVIQINDIDTSATVAQATYERSYGLSLTYDITKNFIVSSAYNKAEFLFNGNRAYSYSWATALVINVNKTQFNYVYFYGKNTEQTDGGSLIEPRGHEAIIKYNLSDKYKVYAGVNYLGAKDDSVEYKIEKYLLGWDYRFNEIRFAAEYKYDDSINDDGVKRDGSAFGLLARMDF